MKRTLRFCAGSTVLALWLVDASLAQSNQPPAAVTPAGKDEVVVLSPFEVNGSADQGYASRETLSGTRFKTNLRDTPSQVSVMTEEFLRDIAAVTPEDAFRYSANIENKDEYFSTTSGNGDLNTGVLNRRIANRIRGLTSPGVTHDFFQSFIEQDTYNSERITISSGPNGILFGRGNPGGIVDTPFVRPNLRRAKYKVSFRTDSEASLRVATDFNQPIVKDKLAVRVALLESNQNHWREPGKDKDERMFGTATFKPFANTTLRLYAERVDSDRTPVRNTRAGDGVTPWIVAGRPAFNNGLIGFTVINATNNTVFARNTVNTRPVYILGDSTYNDYVIWGSPATANPATASTIYSATTNGPGDNAIGTDKYTHSLPNDGNVSPIDISINGNGTRNRLMGKTLGGSFEQRFTKDLFFQADYNRERGINHVADFLRGLQSIVRADANQYLPDRVTLNPNLGKYYVEGQPRAFSSRSEREEMRAMLSYDLDLRNRANWTKWLGRHQMAVMLQRTESMSNQQEFGPRLIPAGVSNETAAANFSGALYNTLAVRAYLSDPTSGSSKGIYSLNLPFDPVRPGSWVLPNGSTYYGIDNPFGATATATLVNSLVDSQVGAMQSYWLKDRLVTSLGYRKDKSRTATYATARKNPAGTAVGNYAFESIYDVAVPRDWSLYQSGQTQSVGAVGHVLKWLSIYWNQSNTWNPPSSARNPDDGSLIKGATGIGTDYGIMVHLFDNRLSLRLDKYHATNGPSVSEKYRAAIILPVRAIETTLQERQDDGTVTAAIPAPAHYVASQDAGFADRNLVSDQESMGYEFELVYNPTVNWRLALNGAKASSLESGIGTAWINLVQERAAVWQQYSDLLGTDGDATKLTIGQRYLGIIQTLNEMQQSSGKKVEAGREWRVNFVTRYSFSHGKLKGAFVGGGYRYRSKSVVGYMAASVPNAFAFAGAPATVIASSLDSPIFGKPTNQADLLLGYERKLSKNVSWRIQLNVNNLLDNRDVLVQRTLLGTGATTVYGNAQPRSYVATTTFEF